MAGSLVSKHRFRHQEQRRLPQTPAQLRKVQRMAEISPEFAAEMRELFAEVRQVDEPVQLSTLSRWETKWMLQRWESLRFVGAGV